MEVYFLISALLLLTGYLCIDHIEHRAESIVTYVVALFHGRAEQEKRRIG